MDTLKDKFVVAARTGCIAKRKDFKENMTDQITTALIDKLLDIISTSGTYNVQINFTDFITKYVEKDTGIHEEIDLHEYAEIICKNLAKHDNIFKRHSKDYAIGYLEAMLADDAQETAKKIENTSGEAHDKSLAKGIKIAIENMDSPKHILFVMFRIGDDDVVYFNWRDFQKSAKLETLD